MPICACVALCRGDEQKANWLLIRTVHEARRCVVFFPGDISDFAAKDTPYSYTLEGLLWVLCCKFPDDNIILVKARMMVDFCAAYANFMFVDAIGNPRLLKQEAESEDASLELPQASRHLLRLLESAERELGGRLPESLVLVGFSKGATVLGSLLREAGDARHADAAELYRRLEAIHYVDAGLTVPGHIFPADVPALRCLSSAVQPGFIMWLHGTPRQLDDPVRPFVGEETEAFFNRCLTAGLRVILRRYSDGEAASLEMHFDCLRCFYTSEEDSEGGDRHRGFFRAWNQAAMEGV